MLDYLRVMFLSHLLNNVTIWAYQKNSWPVVELECVPDVELAVIDASVFDFVADDSLPQHVSCFLFVKLGTVHTYEGDFREVLELCLKLFELCKDVNTVDAAAGPEVNDQKLALELIIHGQWLVIQSVQPL